MFFGFIAALRVKVHYKYLVGQPLLPSGFPITDIAIIPHEKRSHDTFWEELVRTKDPMMAYSMAKIFKNARSGSVNVIVYSLDEKGKLRWRELDRFLVRNKIERIYQQPNFEVLEYEPEYPKTSYRYLSLFF